MTRKDLPFFGALVIAVLVIGSSAAAQWVPVASDADLEQIANVAHGGGAGLVIHDGHAYAGARGGGLTIIDISDPENPLEVSHVSAYARDVAVLEVGDRVVAATGVDWGGYTEIIDVTDPANPFIIKRLSIGAATHNIVEVKGSDLFYNSRSGSSGIDIIDVSDPDDPQVVKVWRDGSLTCHDIEVAPEHDRAYCAGLSATYILDITDRLEPQVIGTVDHSEIRLHHWAFATPDQNTLIIGDEDFGIQDDGCGSGIHTPASSMGGTDGAIWLYDITDPGDAQLIESITPPEDGSGTCTAHFGDMIDDTALLAVGWYTGGVVVIDLGEPLVPRVVDQWQTSNVNVWDVQYHDGHLFTGDLSRGMDVLRLDIETVGLPDL